ncbi:hypothetical protein PL263_14565 [Methylomonas sp. EFPC3]|uniref:hypothetical protein n=1 Tax=Methylomonas sp. EFPC3 TaxID=3021710 RepID=UPI0024175060|nr:hypothetical protein [Methylomonas sp. EFPC3]WFP49316.1 hypothetical protein PL263_14565 [Methylomonas sp. EFPC3]
MAMIGNQPKISTRAGSHAGRGFRYQDATIAWLAVGCWAGDLSYGSVIPEGLDDAELGGPSERVFVQIKSRRDNAGPFGRSDVAKYLKELWIRASAAATSPGRVLLILERDINGIGLQVGTYTPLSSLKAILNLVSQHKFATEWSSKTQILLAPSPMESAIDLIVRKMDCLPLMASVCFAAIADKIGVLSDDNGERALGDFLSLSVSDFEHEIEKLAGVLSSTDLELALQRGLCESVDFLTPIEDRNFYLGTDVQPGHLAAGLLTERPEASTRVLNALERQRAVLIAGPSGSGKSGLLWEAAKQSRHTIRWFRIRNAATESDIVDILRLADTFRASAHMPIGFVIDDVGRHQTGLWDALVTEAATRSNVLLLGSLREEDMFLVARRNLSIEIREQPDTILAERIWRELRDRDQTNWPGWREPWQTCNGLLLEYTHLLTQERRLQEILRDQVVRRVHEKRRNELSVLRVTSMIGRTGGTVELLRLRQTLAINDDDLSDALRRLIDEHLVQKLNTGLRLGSLHQIRAAAMADITHEIPPPFKVETVRHAILCIAPEDMEGFITRTIVREPELVEGIISGAVERICSDGNLILLAAILRGLDTGSIGESVERWLPHLDRLKISTTQATMVAMFAVANTEPFLEEKLQAHFEAAQLLREMVHNDYRLPLLERLERLWPKWLLENPDWHAVRGFLASLVGMQLPSAIQGHLIALRPNLLTMPIAEVAALLETTQLLLPEITCNWVDEVGQTALLDRLTQETPWVSKVQLRNEPEGLAVCADVFYISDRIQTNLHEDVVDVCRKLLAFAPSAELAVCSAISADREPAGIGGVPIATKRVPRSNLPAEALPARNKRWIAAVAQRVAANSTSQYLSEAKRLLEALVPLLEKLIDGVVRGKAKVQFLDTLGAIYEESRKLTRPPDPDVISGENSGIGVSELQNVLNFCSADFLRGLIEAPERAATIYARTSEILKHIDKASSDEPWLLIGDGPPSSLLRLRSIVEQACMIIGESGFRNLKVSQLAPSLSKTSRFNDALRMLSIKIQQQLDARLDALKVELETTIRDCGYVVRAAFRPVNEIGGPWPYAKLLVIVTLERMIDWPATIEAIAEPVRQIAGTGRRITIVPAVGRFCIQEQAFSGVETLFPQAFEDVSWLAELGFSPAEISLGRKFDALIAAILEVSTIKAFGCGGKDRASEEWNILEKANAEIEATLIELESIIPIELRGEVTEFLDSLVKTGADFAVDFWQQIHGDSTSSPTAVITAIKLILLDLD